METEREITTPILIVEDSLFIQSMIKELLTENGFTNIDIANDGLKAIEMMKKKKYSIVLMDILMPNMDGIVAIEEIKKINPKIVIIVVTALINPSIKKSCMELGVHEYINKPFHNQNFIKTIMKYV